MKINDLLEKSNHSKNNILDWIELTIKPIAEEIKKTTKSSCHSISSPMGIDAKIFMTVWKNKEDKINKNYQNSIGFVFIFQETEGKLKLYIKDYTNINENYPKNSVGHMNGFNIADLDVTDFSVKNLIEHHNKINLQSFKNALQPGVKVAIYKHKFNSKTGVKEVLSVQGNRCIFKAKQGSQTVPFCLVLPDEKNCAFEGNTMHIYKKGEKTFSYTITDAPLKVFNLTHNVGSAKYVVNYHDGEQVHKDGSAFYGTELFKNKKKRDQFIKELKNKGYFEK